MDLLQEFLFEQLLDEGLDDVFEKYYKEKLSRELFDRVIAVDPTFKPEQDKMGSYGKWLLVLQIKGENVLDNAEKLKKNLSVYEDKKNSLTQEQKNILGFKTIADLDNLMADLGLAEKSEYQLRAEAVKGAKFITKNANWEVYQPLNYEASKYLRGDDANWCTGHHDTSRYWKDYTSGGGELFIFRNLHGTDEHNVKYQGATKDGRLVDFRDARDDSANFVNFINESGLADALVNSGAAIGQTPEIKIAIEVKELNGKIKYSDLMGVKYLGNFRAPDGNNVDQEMVSRFYSAVVKSVKLIIVDNGIKILPEFIFKGFHTLEKVILPPSLTIIGKGCFTECSSLKEIFIPQGVKKIPAACFDKCKALRSVTITEGTVEFDVNAFDETPDSVVILSPKHQIKVPKSEVGDYKKRIRWIDEPVTESLLTEKLSKKTPEWFSKFFFSDFKPGNRNYNRSGLVASFKEQNIDLNSVEIVETEVPKNARSEFLTDAYIPIFYMSQEKIKEVFDGIYYDAEDLIYIRGITHICVAWGSRYELDNVSLTRILGCTTKFAYIDKSNPKNFINPELQAERAKAKIGAVDRGPGQKHIFHVLYSKKDGSIVDREYDYLGWTDQMSLDRELANKDMPEAERQWTKRIGNWEWVNPDFDVQDKSGYRIPSAQDFKRRLNDMDRRNYAKSIDTAQNKLEDIKNKVQEYMSSSMSDIKDIDTTKTELAADMFREFTNTISLYKKLLSRLDYILLLKDDDRKNLELDQLFKFDRYSDDASYSGLKKRISKLEKMLSKVEYAVIEQLKNN